MQEIGREFMPREEREISPGESVRGNFTVLLQKCLVSVSEEQLTLECRGRSSGERHWFSRGRCWNIGNLVVGWAAGG